MMNPKKTKSGKYHVTALVGKVNGKKKYKSFTAPTKRECILKATEYINHHPTDGSNITIRQAVANYIDAKEKVLSPSTIRSYVGIQEKHFETINDIPLSDFGNYQFQVFISGLDVSPKTCRNIYGLLRASLRMFSDRNYNITLPDKVEPKRTVATQEDVQKLLAAADPELRKAIILGSCSMRRGEVAALKYEDIIDGSLYVHADMVRDKNGQWIYKDSAKTPASTRYIHVSEDVIAALGTGTGYVVNIPNPEAITNKFTRLRNRIGIDVSFHSLRRFYASISHALGVPNEYVMRQGGWKSEAVMVNSYRHTLPEKEKEFSDKVMGEISKII